MGMYLLLLLLLLLLPGEEGTGECKVSLPGDLGERGGEQGG